MTATIIDQVAATPAGTADLAVARFQLRIEGALADAAARHRNPVETIAAALGVPESRVQRVLDGDHPLRVETFIRYMSALGYDSPIQVATVVR